MSKFIVFNDACDTIVDISLIKKAWLGDDEINIFYINDDNIELGYESNRKAIKDYNALIKLLSATEISEYYEDTPKKKLSINQEAMKEVNELLGKSRKKKEPS